MCHGRYVVYDTVVLTSQTYMRDVCAVQPAWLTEAAPQFYSFTPRVGDGAGPPTGKRAKTNG